MTSYCYFADYEIQMGDRFHTRGHVTLIYRIDSTEQFDPAVVIERIRQQAADENDVNPARVRIRALNRLDQAMVSASLRRQHPPSPTTGGRRRVRIARPTRDTCPHA